MNVLDCDGFAIGARPIVHAKLHIIFEMPIPVRFRMVETHDKKERIVIVVTNKSSNFAAAISRALFLL